MKNTAKDLINNNINPLTLRRENNKKKTMEELKNNKQEIENTSVGGFGGSDAALFLRIAKKAVSRT